MKQSHPGNASPTFDPGNYTNLTKLIIAGSYLAGLGFSIGAVMKFKQHHANPGKVPIAVPIGLMFIAGATLLFPSLMIDTEDDLAEESTA